MNYINIIYNLCENGMLSDAETLFQELFFHVFGPRMSPPTGFNR